MKKIKAKIERADGKTNEEEGGGKLFAKIINAEKAQKIGLINFIHAEAQLNIEMDIFIKK